MEMKSQSMRAKYRIGRWFFWLGCIWLIAAGISRAGELTIYETEGGLFGIDPFTSRGQKAKRLVSLYSRPLFQLKFSGLTGNSYNAVLARDDYAILGKTLKVFIRDDAYFRWYTKDATDRLRQDSAKVSARDVVASYKKLIDPKSILRSHWYSNQLNTFVESMSVNTDGSLQVAFRTRPKLSALQFPVVPRSVLNTKEILRPEMPLTSDYGKYSQKPWGCGPFTIKSASGFTQGRPALRLQRTSPGQNNQVRTIYYEYLTKSEISTQVEYGSNKDVCFPALPYGLKAKINSSYKDQPLYSPTIDQIVFNMDEGRILSSHAVRAALSVFIKRQQIIDGLMNSEAEPVNGPFPPKSPGICDECEIWYQNFNADLGFRLLQDSGYVRDSVSGKWAKDGKNLKINFMTYTNSDGSHATQVVQQIADGWREFGIEVHIETVLENDFIQRLGVGRDFDAAFLRVTYESLYPELGRYFMPDAPENYSGMNDPRVEKAWLSLRTADLPELPGIWADLHKQISDMVPCAFLWTPQTYALYSRNTMIISTFWDQDNFLSQVERWRFVE